MSEKLDEFVQRALDKLPPEPEPLTFMYTDEEVKELAGYLVGIQRAGLVKF